MGGIYREAHAPGGGGGMVSPGGCPPTRPPPSTGSAAPPPPSRGPARSADHQSAGLPYRINGLAGGCVAGVTCRVPMPCWRRSRRGEGGGCQPSRRVDPAPFCGLLGASPGNLEVLEDSLEGWTGKSITWAFLPPSLLRWLLPCCGSLLSLSAALLAWLPLGLSLSLWRHTAAGLGSGVSGGASCPVWERSCQSRAWLGSPGCAAAVRNPPHFSDTPSS